MVAKMDNYYEKSGTVSLLGDSNALICWDRNLDGLGLSLNHSELQSLSINPGIKLIGLDEKAIDRLMEMVPGLAKVKIPAGSFDKYQTEDIYTVVSVTSIIGHKDLDADLVYQIVDVLIKNRERINKYIMAEDNVMLEPLTAKGDLPVHPGAMKYYQEKGLVK